MKIKITKIFDKKDMNTKYGKTFVQNAYAELDGDKIKISSFGKAIQLKLNGEYFVKNIEEVEEYDGMRQFKINKKTEFKPLNQPPVKTSNREDNFSQYEDQINNQDDYNDYTPEDQGYYSNNQQDYNDYEPETDKKTNYEPKTDNKQKIASSNPKVDKMLNIYNSLKEKLDVSEDTLSKLSITIYLDNK